MKMFRSVDLYDGRPVKGWLPWGLLAPFLALAFVIATQLAGIAMIAPFVAVDRMGTPKDAFALFAFTLVPFGLLALLVLAWVRIVERRPLAAIGLRGPAPVGAFGLGHVIGMLSILGIVAILWLAGALHVTGEPTAWHSPASLADIGLLLLGFGVQSSVEELLFRGWLFSVLAKKFGVFTGIVVSSALFALLHFSRGEPWLVHANDFAFGVFACAWVMRSHSVVGVMGWHAGWNWLMCVGFGLPLTGLDVGVPALLVDLGAKGPGWLTGGAEGPEGSVVCLAYCCVGTAWLLLRPKRSGAASIPEGGPA
jgi:membrane protease YdiL (CAAX protease family)